MPEPTQVLTESQEGVVTITLNQPARFNALSGAMLRELTAALRAAERDEAVRVIVLTGAGKAFSSGGDLRAMAAEAESRANQPVHTTRYYKHGIQRIPLAFERLDVPIIAAVNGPAVGAGLDLACMCDIRIAAESGRFAESFVKVGLIAGDGGAWLLPRAVGAAKAAEMAFTGDTLDAEVALACGLVSRVVPDGELLATARALAEKIAANPPDAVRMTKRLLLEGRHARMDTLLEMAAAMQALAHATTDHREAANAFLEKRAPRFTGA